MILNTDIYERTVNLIDDPDINRAYLTNTIEFQRIMYNFLINGLSYFTAPIKVCDALAQQVAPDGETEVGVGDGSKKYKLTMTIPDDAELMFSVYDYDQKKKKWNKTIVSGELDKQPDGVYAVFPSDVTDAEKYEVRWYTPGYFSANFPDMGKAMNGASLNNKIVEILARTTVIAWAEKEQNFLLDIRNLLNDTDFKLHSPANSLKTKIEWLESLRREIYSLQTKLDWDLRSRTVGYYNY